MKLVFVRFFLVSFLIVGLSGCTLLRTIGFGGGAGLETYDLRPVSMNLQTECPMHVSIRVPHAIKALNSERVMFRPSPTMVTYLSGVQWADSLPKLLAERLLNAFEDSGSLLMVSRFSDSLAADYQIFTDIRDFSIIRLPEERVAHVQIHARLVADRQGRALADQSFEASIPVDYSGSDSAVYALDHALSVVLQDVVSWTIDLCPQRFSPYDRASERKAGSGL